MLKFTDIRMVEVSDWDELVRSTYNRPYNFQQQDDCKPRGVHYLTIPGLAYDYENDSVPEVVNHPDMGVSFKAWLERDPTKLLDNDDPYNDLHSLVLWWERNFYPDVQMIANDLHARGLVEAGKYAINIDW